MTEARETFVGVNLLTKKVVAVALLPDLIRDAYILRGRVDAEGRIVLDPDRSWNGKEATAVCFASQGCGLGWQFVAGGGKAEKPFCGCGRSGVLRLRSKSLSDGARTMIEILLSNGDRAEADDPESAALAARTMMDDAERAGAASCLLTASFYVEGGLVRSGVRRAEIQ